MKAWVLQSYIAVMKKQRQPVRKLFSANRWVALLIRLPPKVVAIAYSLLSIVRCLFCIAGLIDCLWTAGGADGVSYCRFRCR